VQGSVRLLDGGIGATKRSVLGLAGHDLGERESEQRERKRAEKRRVAGGDRLGVARDSEKESRQ
jgi:hypothetical protein